MADPIKGPQKPTSMDIAYLAGVSQPTVSRALRGSSMVHPDTRKRIEKIAKELNYSVNKSAASLRRQESNTLALLFFEDPSSDGSDINPFFLSMLGSITRASSLRGYDLLVSFQKLTDNWHVRYLDSNRADGLILLGYGDYLQYKAYLEQLVAQGTPFVRWGSPTQTSTGTVLGSDNLQGGYLASCHLLEHRRKHLAFIGTATANYPEFLGRYRGYKKALMKAGIDPNPLYQIDALSDEQAGFDAMMALLDRNIPIDGIVAASDLLAIGAMRAIHARNIAIPDNIAVVGFDDIPAASLSYPALTTVSQDITMAGQALVDAILASIEGESVDSRAYPTHLVIRQSTPTK